MTAVFSGTQIAVFDPPQIVPSRTGLYQHVDWIQDGDPARFLMNDGVAFRPMNFGGSTAFGVLDAAWCVDPDVGDLDGSRPAIDKSSPFVHETVWASDENQCGDMTEESRQEVRDRAQRNMLRLEQVAAETQFATRLLTDAGTPATATSLADAVGQIEDAAAKLGVGDVLIHARPYWGSQEPYDVVMGPPPFQTTLGSTWVFGGGYVSTLANTLVATTQVYGWRGGWVQNEAIKHQQNRFVSIVERSVLLGYEKIIAAVTIS